MFQRRILERDIPNVKLVSPKGNPVVAEWAKLRERSRGEKVHLRLKDELNCSACGLTLQGNATPWLDSKDRLNDHPDRCATFTGED